MQRSTHCVSKFALCSALFGFAFLTGSAAAQSPNGAGAAVEPSTPAKAFGEGVRSTPWQTPEQERSGFHLPPGFEIRLFASEPEIAKPLNMAFDDRGRMWLTQSTAYPYPAGSDGSEDDAVMILSDNDGDGHADEIKQFAGGLNIPIGVLPYRDGCICFSIPHIWYLRDRDGDDVCDERIPLLGPFDTSRDTHGMINALRDGGDGWIYACHGFNNRSEVSGSDGHVVRLYSGNTFRFRPDGSRIEQVTQGQVNPFGMTEDDWGYRYSADCHSKPITQLISGACYPSFGRPHDGLGFLPPMMTHLHGSTAISGVAHIGYASRLKPLHGQILSGNVMTSRINRNGLTYQGATARGEKLDDFLTADDPWFRPVDLHLGPAGHLYVADFYNRIIGHYEVPLDHPGRDRRSGRVWQIRYRGESDGTQARDEVPSDRDAPKTVSHALGIIGEELARRPLESMLTEKAWNAASEKRKVAILKLVSETSDVSFQLRRRLLAALEESCVHVKRAAAEAIGQLPNAGSQLIADELQGLLVSLENVSEQDPVLRQTLRIAIRRKLRQASDAIWNGWCDSVVKDASPQRQRELVSILAGMSLPQAADTILDYLEVAPERPSHASPSHTDLIRHAAEHASLASLERCVAISRAMSGGNSSLREQSELLDLVAGEGGTHSTHATVRQWASELAVRAGEVVVRKLEGQGQLVRWSSDGETAWPRQDRPVSSGSTASLMSSHRLGEQYRGVLTSDAFRAPEMIRFWLAGHNGHPKQPDSEKNFVRLVSAEDGRAIFRALPPRSDTAALTEWDTSELDEWVRLECVDHHDASAYAWIAIGEIEPLWLHEPSATDAFELLVRLTERHRLDQTGSLLRTIAESPFASPETRVRAATALRKPEDPALAMLMRLNVEKPLPVDLQFMLLNLCSFVREPDSGDSDREQQINQIVGSLEAHQQDTLVKLWASSSAALDPLLSLCESGQLARTSLAGEQIPQLLRARASRQQRTRLKRLLQGIDPADQTQQALLVEVKQSVLSSPGEAIRGQAVFKQHCASCHQIHGQGAVVGPQLDGAAPRSIPRLLEDVITPNRNVDAAFRSVSFLLVDGRVVIGMVQSEEHGVIHLADREGKTSRLDAEQVAARTTSDSSLMPANFGQLLSASEFADLLAFIKQDQ